MEDQQKNEQPGRQPSPMPMDARAVGSDDAMLNGSTPSVESARIVREPAERAAPRVS